MRDWKPVWRAMAGTISTQGLCALATALRMEDDRLRPGWDTVPPPLAMVADKPVQAACVVGYCGWQGERLHTVGQVMDFTRRVRLAAERQLDEAGVTAVFYNWLDDTPWPLALRNLLIEVEGILRERRLRHLPAA